ncbi:hypothetical protein [Brevibacillus sp. BC25]|uniref:DUF6906 family protein n=1 Tax=Brevibacillus sp. BC25 TaxID=1144308 RepID=UPI000271305B|nr:hypothetical protein [Brevibacillus sp. BC25]EJL29986.1 hypothetical protein PMI05_01602 [Brevibacillus sp. BC25]
MKQGKRPSRQQKEELEARNLNPANWLVERDSTTELVLINRFSGKTRTIKKGA